MAVRDGKFMAVGKDKQMKILIGKTTEVKGFIDACTAGHAQMARAENFSVSRSPAP